MRKTIALLALLLPLAAAPLRAAGPSDDFRAKFKPYEQWMLDVVLSDPKQKTLFDADAAAAERGGEDAVDATMKWRKTLAAFSAQFKDHLDHVDLIPGAKSVEQMIDQNEFNITQYYWLRKPAKDREQFLSDIATGNKLLPYGGRGLVEGKVRAGRQKFSADIGAYLADPDVKAALNYVPPAPKPVVAPAPPAPAPAVVAREPKKPAPKKPVPPVEQPQPPAAPTVAPDADATARDQLNRAARDGQTPGGGESASERTGSGFTGAGTHGAPPPAPVDAAPAALPTLTGPDLSHLGGPPALPGAPQGGFVVAAPPSPVLDRSKPHEEGGSNLKVAIVKYGPAVLGAVVLGGLFAALGALFGGPLLAVAGGLVGAALGVKAGQWAAKKFLGLGAN